MDYKDLRELARIAVRADKSAPVAYSFEHDGMTEQFSIQDVNNALRKELFSLIDGESGNRYAAYRENKNTIFRLIEESIDLVLPARVEEQYMQFADVKVVPQGDKAVFHKRITEASRQRAKRFVTQVGLAGRYETFMVDGADYEVKMSAIGAAVRIGFEEFLDGRILFSDLTDIILEGMDDYIYREVAKALATVVTALPAANQGTYAGFDEDTMDELLAIADSYGHSTIYCTYEFASKMKPVEASWASNDMKTTLWRNGFLGDYKGHTVVIMRQSMLDETNETKAIDPSMAYIIPVGSDKPVKMAFEGPTCVRTVDVNGNDDWSQDMQMYKKFGVAILANHWICAYKNTNLTTASRS